MTYIAIPTPVTDETVRYRDSIGGYPILPKGYDWPLCPQSQEEMVLFMQFDVSPELGIPALAGMHFAVFMSPKINEIPSFDFLSPGAPLQQRFWDKREPHCKVFLFPRTEGNQLDRCERHLQYLQLTFAPGDATPGQITVGGSPSWVQDPEMHSGPQGEELHFLCEIPDDYAFPKRPQAPEQPDSFSSQDYCLFLGNYCYFFGVPAIDHPEAIWLTVQN